jgi:hypothetical protein
MFALAAMAALAQQDTSAMPVTVGADLTKFGVDPDVRPQPKLNRKERRRATARARKKAKNV